MSSELRREVWLPIEVGRGGGVAVARATELANDVVRVALPASVSLSEAHVSLIDSKVEGAYDRTGLRIVLPHSPGMPILTPLLASLGCNSATFLATLDHSRS